MNVQDIFIADWCAYTCHRVVTDATCDYISEDLGKIVRCYPEINFKSLFKNIKTIPGLTNDKEHLPIGLFSSFSCHYRWDACDTTYSERTEKCL